MTSQPPVPVPTDAEHTARAKAMMLDLSADEIIACIHHLARKANSSDSRALLNVVMCVEDLLGQYPCAFADAESLMEYFNEGIDDDPGLRPLTENEARMIALDLSRENWDHLQENIRDAFWERAYSYLEWSTTMSAEA